ncbi:MAG: universal stress protein [Anaerolineae bacterium]|jgi:nucleotide-binding universal stress UspA family protein
MYEKIVVALDGSPLAEQALPHAVAHAERFGAELALLKVLEPLPEVTYSSPAAVRTAEEMSAQIARDYLEGLAAGLNEQGIQVQVVTLEGKPYVQIVRYAEEEQADLLVMSTRGQSGFSRWLLGSVADRVVRGATVPVLLVRCQEDCTG